MAALEIASLPLTILTRLYIQKAPDQVLLAFFGLTAVGVVIAAYILLHISQCFFLMLDFPDYSASELLKQSSRIMKGHKIRLLMLCVSFAPLLIMSLFTFGIANLWIIPYLDVSRAFFFMNLMQAREAAMGEEPLEYQ